MFVAIGIAALIYALSSTYRSAGKGYGAVSVLSGRYCDHDGCSAQSSSDSTALNTAIPSFRGAIRSRGQEVVWDDDPEAQQLSRRNTDQQPEVNP